MLEYLPNCTEFDLTQGFILNSETADELLMSLSRPCHQDKEKGPVKAGIFVAAYLL
ncbi:hypothetical protein SynRS9915_01400 [Synechococcus sp. RS9915]|nr:hypothetical protein SynRS9915_01400 [Synechococcus sp. RS9915]